MTCKFCCGELTSDLYCLYCGCYYEVEEVPDVESDS